MSPSRIALAAAGGALVAAWLAAAATAPRRDVTGSAPPPAVPGERPGTAPATTAVDLAAEMERLQQRLTNAPALRVGVRNPFALSAPAPPPGRRTVDTMPGLAAPTASRGSRERRPAVDLIGIATTNAGVAAERTGILTTAGGDVLLVRNGDSVPGGYRVDAVASTSVTLVDASGVRHRLELP